MDAHVIVLLHRPWDEAAAKISFNAELIVPAQRNGDTGVIAAHPVGTTGQKLFDYFFRSGSAEDHLIEGLHRGKARYRSPHSTGISFAAGCIRHLKQAQNGA
jgi:hypothetical protein